MNGIILDQIRAEKNVVRCRLKFQGEMAAFFNKDEFFIQYEDDIESVPQSILAIPFVSCIAGLTWIADSQLWLDEIDKTFYRAFARLKRAYQELHSDYGFGGELIPSVFKENSTPANERSILLFGGGTDCQASFIRNESNIDTVLNIFGWLGDIKDEDPVEKHDLQVTEDFCSAMGKTSAHIRSNIFSALNLKEIDRRFQKKMHAGYWYAFLHSMAFISMAIPLAWKKSLSQIIIASSFGKGVDKKTHGYCASLVTTDSEFSWAENGNTLHDGYELERQDKVRLIVDYQKKTGKQMFLQVCSFNDRNCCVCGKCFRTVIQIVAEGGDPRLFGFSIEGSLYDFYSSRALDIVHTWNYRKEQSRYWAPTVARMKENYEAILDKPFADWFMTFDFAKAEKQGLRKYYKKNFWKIIKRKLKISG
jgi:hypothetical protein